MIKMGFGIATIVLSAVLGGCGGIGTGVNGNPEVIKQQNPTPNDSAAPDAPVTTPPTNGNNGMSNGTPGAPPTQNPPGSQMNNAGSGR